MSSSTAWDRPESFPEILGAELKQAPWLLLSIALHAVAIFLLWNVGWEARREARETATAVEAMVVDEAPPPEAPPLPPEPVPEDVATKPEIEEMAAEAADDQVLEPDFVPNVADDPSPFLADGRNDVIGIGGGAGGGGGKIGNRIPRRNRPGGHLNRNILAGLDWLARHQDADGKWDADGFDSHCPAGEKCTGHGSPVHDVGLTGLALLAFLGDGNTLTGGRHKQVVKSAVRWLTEQQDEEGLIGERAGQSYIYSHLIATIALCEAFGLSRYGMLRGNVQNAVNYISSSRNPYKAWRYHPRDGDNDSSVTGWAVLALASARSFDKLGLRVDDRDLTDALAWFDEMTDPNTGRVGYITRGSPPARPAALMERYPAERSEAITAVALMARFFAGQDPATTPAMVQHADLIVRKPPVWDEKGGGIDMYYWYYGTYALFQMGGRYWKEWTGRMEKAVVGSQMRGSRHDQGSWNPAGVWGEEGGRVYATAMMVLCLEGYYRYTTLIPTYRG